MVQINFAQKEIQCKIVYYGPGMSGKTTNLELVHGKVPDDNRGELTSIATTGERTLYFDYMPLDLGQIAGIQTKFQLYTVPGQIYYKSTRRLVLQGVDGVVFVADSSAAKLKENKESFADLEENLKEMGKTLHDVPIIVQYNKRDIPDAMSIEDLEKEVNPHGFPYIEAIATTGEGIFPTLKVLSQKVLEEVNKGGLSSGGKRKPRPTAVKAPAAQAPAPAHAVAPQPVAAAAGAGAGAPAVSRPTGGMPPQPSYTPPAGGGINPGAHPPMGTTPGAPLPPAQAPMSHAPSSQYGGSMPHTPQPGSYSSRSLSDRTVKVSGLGGGISGGKLAVVIALGLMIATAAFLIVKSVA